MIKELIYLIKLLFTKIPNKLQVVKLRHFPFKGYSAMMWCGKLITKQTPSYIVMNHERIHLRQAKIKDSWFKYYFSYLWEYIKHLPVFDIAYHTNPYEMEAYANEKNYYYEPSKNSTNRYRIKGIRKKYLSFTDYRKWYKYLQSI